VLTDQLDKNGITKETKEEDLKKKEKLPKRTDLYHLFKLPNLFLFSLLYLY